MKALPRLFVCVVFALILAAGAGLGYARLAGDGESLLGDFGLFFDACRRRQDLGRDSAAVLRRVQAKEEVMDELVAGRMSLREAVACFRAIHAANPDGLAPGAAEEEWTARNVAHWLKERLRSRGPQGKAVLRRLEYELKELLRGQQGGGPRATPSRTVLH